MGIHSFLKAEKGDPDWAFSPDNYFGKEFKIIDASSIEISSGVKDLMVLRQDPNDKNLLAKHIKIDSKPRSQLDLVIINDAEDKLQQVFIYDIHLHEHSIINFGIFVKGGKFNKHIIQVTLDEGSNFSAFGLMENNVGGDTEIITKIVHQTHETSSRQFILGRSGDNSQTVFQAMVVQEEGGEGSEATVESMNLVTGVKGRCFSKPEIYANCDVAKSITSASVEHLTAEKIYYLQSRGIDPKTAAKTIIKGFQNQSISLLPYDDLRNEITEIFN
jgi:hypothetical protein